MKKNNFGGNDRTNSNNSYNSQSNSNANQDDIKKAYNTYSQMSQNDLMNQMFQMAKISKQRGELDNQKLEQFYNSVSQMLSTEDREKLKQLLNMLRD